MHQSITLAGVLSLCSVDVLIHLTSSLILICISVYLHIVTYILCKSSFHLNLYSVLTLYITNVVLLLKKTNLSTIHYVSLECFK